MVFQILKKKYNTEIQFGRELMRTSHLSPFETLLWVWDFSASEEAFVRLIAERWGGVGGQQFRAIGSSVCLDPEAPPIEDQWYDDLYKL